MLWSSHTIACRCYADVFHRNLGEKTSFIELNTPSMTAEQIIQLEKLVNEKIMSGVSMYPTLYESKDDPSLHSVSMPTVWLLFISCFDINYHLVGCSIFMHVRMLQRFVFSIRLCAIVNMLIITLRGHLSWFCLRKNFYFMSQFLKTSKEAAASATTIKMPDQAHAESSSRLCTC